MSSKLKALLENASIVEAIQIGAEFLSQDFHNYSGEEDVIFEDTDLDRFTSENNCFDWGNGVTKVALISHSNGFVLKKAFSGSIEPVYDDDGLEVDYTSGEAYESDECEVEYKIYKEAVKEDLGKFFAETIQLEDGVYLQEAYEMSLEDSYGDEELRYEKFMSPLLLKYYDEGCLYDWAKFHAKLMDLDYLFNTAFNHNDKIFAIYVSMYTFEELYCLQKFLEEYDINDLHSSNIGWFGNELKFIDFSGYGTATASIVSSKKDKE